MNFWSKPNSKVDFKYKTFKLGTFVSVDSFVLNF